jgi:hypothetical protein
MQYSNWQKLRKKILYLFDPNKVLYSTTGPSRTIEKTFMRLTAKGRWESNINVWFPFMYSQKWNCAQCAASLFPKQNYNVLSPNSYTHISVRDLYLSRIGLPIFAAAKSIRYWEYINRSQTHECGNWDWGRVIPEKEYINGIFVECWIRRENPN